MWALWAFMRRTITPSISGRKSAATFSGQPSPRAIARAAVMSQPRTWVPPIRSWPPRCCTRSQTCQPSRERGAFSAFGQSGHVPSQASQ